MATQSLLTEEPQEQRFEIAPDLHQFDSDETL